MNPNRISIFRNFIQFKNADITYHQNYFYGYFLTYALNVYSIDNFVYVYLYVKFIISGVHSLPPSRRWNYLIFETVGPSLHIDAANATHAFFSVSFLLLKIVTLPSRSQIESCKDSSVVLTFWELLQRRFTERVD